MNNKDATDVFSVHIHHPGQRYRYSQTKRDWNTLEPSKDHNHGKTSYGMKFYIFGLEVMHKRNTRNTPCNEDRTIDDHKIRQRMIKDIGCIPPYWTHAQKICSNRTQLEQYFQMNIDTLGEFNRCGIGTGPGSQSSTPVFGPGILRRTAV